MKTRRGSNRTQGAPALPGAGRPPQSMTIRVGDIVALRYGWGAPMELGTVKEMPRGGPRTAVVELRDGTTVWIMTETPKD